MNLKTFNFDEWDWDQQKAGDNHLRIFTKENKKVLLLTKLYISSLTHDYDHEEIFLSGIVQGNDYISFWNIDGTFTPYSSATNDLMMENIH